MLLKIVVISCLVACVSCAGRQVRSSPADSQASPVGADKAAQQQAKLHYVEIGPSLKGDYKFGYDTGSGPAGQSFREETRLDDGTVKGAYGYVDANGKQRIVKYTAGKAGFVVESDADAGASAAAAPARQEPRPEPAQASQPLVPAALPQQHQQQPNFDDQPAPVQINRQAAAAANQVNAEQQHAQQLRQHQLAQQRALAEQQQLAQQQQQLLQQQQQQQQAQFAAQQQSQRAQVPQQQQQQPLPPQAQPQFQPLPPQQHFPTAQSAAHQFADQQTGHFFSSSNDGNINQLLMNQLRQLQAPQTPQPQQQFAQQQFGHAQPGFPRQPSFGPIQPAAGQQPQPVDFSHQLRARQASQQQQPQQAAPLASPQSALLALHQQQQHDAQLLAQLRAQQLAQVQQQNRFAQQQPPAPQQAAPLETRAAASQQQQQFLAQPQFAQHQPQQQAQSQQAQPQQQQQQQQLAANVATPSQPAEVFGPPVIDIRTLNYSIGQQTRVN